MKKLLKLFFTTIIILSLCSIGYASNKYSVKRIYGIDRYETSMKICEEFNSGQTNNIIIASGANFPDALAGSVLSKKLNAPILLVNSTDMEKSITYIKSHLIKYGNIYILGGFASVSNTYENHLKSLGYNTLRLGGINRFDTNKAIVSNLSVKQGTPIILVNGYGFADALSISSIASSNGYPIVMTDCNNLPNEAKHILSEVKPSKVYLIGGEGVLNDTIKTQVEDITSMSSNSIVRIGGHNRYETSLNICKYFNLNTPSAIIANGQNFPDALSGSALGTKLNAPIILTDGLTISEQKKYLDQNTYSDLILLGGTGAVCQSIENILMGKEVSLSDNELTNLIPSGTEIYINDNKKKIFNIDIDNDGQNEWIVGYTTSPVPENAEYGYSIIKFSNGKLEKIYDSINSSEPMMKYAKLINVEVKNNLTDRPTLLIDNYVGASAGHYLDLFTINNGQLEKLYELNCHKIEFEDLQKKDSSKDGLLEIKVTQRNYDVPYYKHFVLGWDGNKIINVDSLYPSYFKNVVVPEYLEQAQALGQSPLNYTKELYSLATAEYLADMKNEARSAISDALYLIDDTSDVDDSVKDELQNYKVKLQKLMQTIESNI